MESSGEREYVLSSVLRGIELLRRFRPDKPEWGVTELAAELNITKSSVHRILITLLEHGFAKQQKNRKYVLGPRVLQLANTYACEMPLLHLAEPVLRDLARRMNKVCHLAKLCSGEVYYLRSFPPCNSFHFIPAVSRPLHSTALGKVLLAHLKTTEQDRVIEEIELSPFTPRTITDRDELRNQLCQVAQQGYALDRGELRANFSCVAAPLFNRKSHLVAAISLRVSGFPEVDVTEYIEPVCWEAERISRAMGGPGLPGLRKLLHFSAAK